MEPDEYTISDPALRDLGLVDPSTGRPVAGLFDDRGATPSAATPPAGEATDSSDGEAGAQPPAGDATPQATPDWESDDNPYKVQAKELAAKQQPADPQPMQTYQQAVTNLQMQAREAYTALVNGQGPDGQKWEPAVAKQFIEANYAAMHAQLTLEHERSAMLPVARRAAAEKIAQEVSLPNATVEAKDLEGEPTVEAMRARARTLVETRRNTTFQQRKETQADKAEGSPPASKALTEAYEKLPPVKKIALGIARGQ